MESLQCVIYSYLFCRNKLIYCIMEDKFGSSEGKPPGVLQLIDQLEEIVGNLLPG